MLNKRPCLKIVSIPDERHRILLNDVDITDYVQEFRIDIENDQAEIQSIGGEFRLVPTRQRTRVMLTLLDIELVSTDGRLVNGDLMALTRNRRLDL